MFHVGTTMFPVDSNVPCGTAALGCPAARVHRAAASANSPGTKHDRELRSFSIVEERRFSIVEERRFSAASWVRKKGL